MRTASTHPHRVRHRRLNSRHLELFSYVVLHRGITPALPHLPWGIQRSALAHAMRELEIQVGKGPLFVRKPFSLTAAGAKLASVVTPAFRSLASLDHILDGAQDIAVGISSVVEPARWIPSLIRLREGHPRPRLLVERGPDHALHEQLANGRLDLVIASPCGPLDSGIASTPVQQLAPALIVANDHWLVDAKQLWAVARIDECLVQSSDAASLASLFQQDLARLGVVWPPMVIVDSLTAVAAFVQQRGGIGLTVDVPAFTHVPGIRTLPLRHFEPLPLNAYTRKTNDRAFHLLLGALRNTP